MLYRRVYTLLESMLVLRTASFCSNTFVVPLASCQRSPHHCSSAFARLSSTLLQSVDAKPFEECWKANTWSVNPLNTTCGDTILQRLTGPAPQSLFVLKRAIIRQHQGSNLEQTLSQCTFLLKPGYEFQIKDDLWRIEASKGSDSTSDEWRSVQPRDDNNMNAVELAREALDIAIDASERQNPIDYEQLNDIAQEAKDRLSLTLGTDIRGRSSADAAFAFAMAGVTDEDLYEVLALIASLELKRVGQRPSFRSKYVLQMVEKLAASGINNDGDLYRVAADCLASKGEHMDVAEKLSRPNEFNLFSTRPLLWLWRFSARQRKVASVPMGQRREDEVGVNKYSTSKGDWVRGFDDPSLPLVVDIGCGMGISPLGLASIDQMSQDSFNSSPEGSLLGEINWRECNYVGGDLSQLCLGYRRSIARRWGLNGSLQFAHGSALELLESVDSHYQGMVALIMIQFPTPFQLKDTGNPQLPSDIEAGFMVSNELLKKTNTVLEHSGGFLLLQSNCEDVAVTMRETAEHSAGLASVGVPSSVKFLPVSDSDVISRTPQRTLDWIQMGGRRPVGDGWSLTPLIPPRGATETEVSCQLNKTPIHRCLLQPRQTK